MREPKPSGDQVRDREIASRAAQPASGRGRLKARIDRLGRPVFRPETNLGIRHRDISSNQQGSLRTIGDRLVGKAMPLQPGKL
jgi:hypothetical protein